MGIRSVNRLISIPLNYLNDLDFSFLRTNGLDGLKRIYMQFPQHLSYNVRNL